MNQKVKKVKQILIVVFILTAVAGFSSCEKFAIPPIPFDPTTTWHFQADIQPVFDANCIACHNGTRSPDLRSGKSFNALSKGYISAPAESSILYVQITTNSQHIPRTTDTEKLKILYWIKQGALNN